MRVSLIGWRSAESFIDERILLFLGKLMVMKHSMLPKQIFLTRTIEFRYGCVSNSLGFIPDIHRLLLKYGLFDFDNYLLTGRFPSYNLWKKSAKAAIQITEESSWRERTNNDINFVFLSRIHTMADAQFPAWTLGRKLPELQEQCRFIISLCTLVRPYNEQHTLCDKCGRFLGDITLDIIASCESMQTQREKCWCDLINIGPIEFSAHLHSLTEIYFLANILSCRSDFNLNGDERTIFQQACLINVYAMCRT